VAHSTSEASGFGALAVAEVTTQYGINRAFARATSSDAGVRFPPDAVASARSQWYDELTIGSSAPGGLIEVEFQFHAFATESSYSYFSSMLEYEVQLVELFGGNQITQYYLNMDGLGNVNSYLPGYTDGFELVGDNPGDILRIVGVKIPFTSNLTFGIASTLACGARAPYDGANIQVCDASGTAMWGGIRAVTDADGNPLTDWTVRSASGFDYTPSLYPRVEAAVPEPHTWAMLILGFGAAGLLIRRRRAGARVPA